VATVVVDFGGLQEIDYAIDAFLDDELGPLIVDDAKRYAPKRTGLMAEGITHSVQDQTLYIISAAPYTLWVEFGHRVFHPSTGIAGPDVVPEEPFIRPAVYKYRTPAVPSPPALMPTAVAHPGPPSLPTLFQYLVQRLGWRINRQ
jgi:hypothetical protein